MADLKSILHKANGGDAEQDCPCCGCAKGDCKCPPNCPKCSCKKDNVSPKEAMAGDLQDAGYAVEEFKMKGGTLLRQALDAIANCDPSSKYLTQSLERKINNVFMDVVSYLDDIIDKIPEEDDGE